MDVTLGESLETGLRLGLGYGVGDGVRSLFRALLSLLSGGLVAFVVWAWPRSSGREDDLNGSGRALVEFADVIAAAS